MGYTARGEAEGCLSHINRREVFKRLIQHGRLYSDKILLEMLKKSLKKHHLKSFKFHITHLGRYVKYQPLRTKEIISRVV